jgi:hypothetical protein
MYLLHKRKINAKRVALRPPNLYFYICAVKSRSPLALSVDLIEKEKE